tara:strand:- start:1451 stop:1750 length:300 start_codon:yes stop_codon:yes gene_type:complete
MKEIIYPIGLIRSNVVGQVVVLTLIIRRGLISESGEILSNSNLKERINFYFKSSSDLKILNFDYSQAKFNDRMAARIRHCIIRKVNFKAFRPFLENFRK